MVVATVEGQLLMVSLQCMGNVDIVSSTALVVIARAKREFLIAAVMRGCGEVVMEVSMKTWKIYINE